MYANVTSNSVFPLQTVLLHYENSTSAHAVHMYQYNVFPTQQRHSEDPLINTSNDPCYGFELGQRSRGETMTYWVEAVDVANNVNVSSVHSFLVG